MVMVIKTNKVGAIPRWARPLKPSKVKQFALVWHTSHNATKAIKATWPAEVAGKTGHSVSLWGKAILFSAEVQEELKRLSQAADRKARAIVARDRAANLPTMADLAGLVVARSAEIADANTGEITAKLLGKTADAILELPTAQQRVIAHVNIHPQTKEILSIKCHPPHESTRVLVDMLNIAQQQRTIDQARTAIANIKPTIPVKRWQQPSTKQQSTIETTAETTEKE